MEVGRMRLGKMWPFRARKRAGLGVEILDGELRAAAVDHDFNGPIFGAALRIPVERLGPGERHDRAVVNALRSLVPLAGGRLVVTALPGNVVIERVITMPGMPEREMDEAVRYEAEQQIPVPLDDVFLRHVVLGPAPGDGRMVAVLVAAAPREAVRECHGWFAEAGLTLTAIDLPALALWRLFCMAGEGDGPRDPKVLAAVEDGIVRLVVGRNGRIVAVRTVVTSSTAAGHTGVRTAALSVPEAAAASEGGVSPAPAIDVRTVTLELRRSIDYFRGAFGAEAPEIILITGSGATVPGLRERLAADLALPVETAGFPARANGREDAEPFEPAFAVAAGLALWGVNG